MKLININNKLYAIGLWWQMQELQSPNKLREIARNLRESITDENYNSFVFYHDKFREASFLGIEDVENQENFSKKNQKIQALVLALKESLNKKSWLLKVVFEDGVWVVGVNEGLLLLDGDFFGEAQKAEEIYNELIQLNDDWDDLYIFQSETDFQNWISDVLTNTTKFYLKSIKRIYPVKKIIIGLLIIILIKSGFVGMAWWQKKQQIKRKKNKKKVEQIVQHKFNKVWLSKLYPDQQIKQWEDIIFNQTIDTNKGWYLKEIVCSPKQIVITKQRLAYGTFNDLPDNAEFNFKKPNLITIKKNLTTRDVLRKKHSLLTQTKFAQIIYEITKIMSAKLHIEWGKPIIITIKEKTFIASFKKNSWTISNMKVFPKEIDSQLINIPGTILTKLIFKNNLWSIEGVTYVQK